MHFRQPFKANDAEHRSLRQTPKLPAVRACFHCQPGLTDHKDWQGCLIEGSWGNQNSEIGALVDLATIGCHSTSTAYDMRDEPCKFLGQRPWRASSLARGRDSKQQGVKRQVVLNVRIYFQITNHLVFRARENVWPHTLSKSNFNWSVTRCKDCTRGNSTEGDLEV